VKILNARKAGEAEAGGKCAEREENGARERFLAQAEEGEEEMHNPSMYSDGAEGVAWKGGPFANPTEAGFSLRAEAQIVLLHGCRG
jgi:hypothetical protein